MEHVSCYNCGSSEATDFAQENGFCLVKCRDCGLLYVNPRPSEEEIDYAHKLGQHRGAELIQTTGYYDFSKVSSYTATLQEMFSDGSALYGKTWLDIGCGYGEFLLALKRFSSNGLLVKGVEPNLTKATSAKNRGLDVSYFDLAGHKEKYDYISILNVYSHLSDPRRIIGEWRSLLVPGGELILETGDTADLNSEQHPKPFFLPDHLSFASEAIVRNLLEELCFEVIGVLKYPEVRDTGIGILREAIKVVIPRKKSKLLRWIKGDMKCIDMYIHARLKM